MAQQVILQIGDRSFTTTKATLVHGTLDGSQYFANLFSPVNATTLASLTLANPSSSSSSTAPQSDSNTTPPSDNKPAPAPSDSTPTTLLLDHDPRTFHHILDYLRTGIMPLLWHEDRGFDTPAYARLERLAAHLQIPRLLAWLQRRQYLQAVQQNYSADIHTLGKGIGQHQRTVQFGGGAERVQCHVTRAGDFGASVVVVRKWTSVDHSILFDETQ